jgi:hypothetical protein
MLWYRAYEGLVSDPKLHEIAADCKVPRALVIAVWHSLLESCASEESERFSTNPKRISLNLHEKSEKVEKILKCFSENGMIVDGCVFRWSERQFRSDSSTPRVKRYREKKRIDETPPSNNGQGNVSETLHETGVKRFGNAPEQNREEHKGERAERNTQRTAPRSASPVFVPPSLLEISQYCQERGNTVNPEIFLDHYQANGWKVGKNAMKDWKASIRTWEKSEYNKKEPKDMSEAELRSYFEAEEREKQSQRMEVAQ